MRSKIRSIAVVLAVVVYAALLYKAGMNGIRMIGAGGTEPSMSRAALISKIANRQVKRATITESQIDGELTNGENFTAKSTGASDQVDIGRTISRSGGEVTFVSDSQKTGRLFSTLFSYGPRFLLWMSCILTVFTLLMFGMRKPRARPH